MAGIGSLFGGLLEGSAGADWLVRLANTGEDVRPLSCRRAGFDPMSIGVQAGDFPRRLLFLGWLINEKILDSFSFASKIKP
jgi:hypothetical protein